METFNEFINEQLQDPEFANEWEYLSMEVDLVNAITTERKKRNMTQKALAEQSGVSRRTIYRLERFFGSPTLETLHTLGLCLGLKLVVQFQPLSPPPANADLTTAKTSQT